MPLPSGQFATGDQQAEFARFDAARKKGGLKGVIDQAREDSPLLDMTVGSVPFVGGAMMGDDIRSNWNQGNYKTAAVLAALGVLPQGKNIAKAGKAVGKNADELVNALRDRKLPNPVQSAVKEDEHGYRRITGPVGNSVRDTAGQTRPDAGRTRGLIEDSEARGYRGRGNNSDELAAVKQLIDNPDQNPAVQLARQFNPQFDPRIVNSMPGSSMGKQMPIAKLYDTMYDVGNVDPKMQAAVFASYVRNMPDVVRKSGATNYNELTEAAYEQLRKETQQQFDAMRNSGWNMSYHNDGRGNYHNSQEMLIDLLRNKHLYTFGGGDVHPGLNAINPETGLNSNEMFRAVHDALGHGTTGSSFGRKGEELAYGAHGELFSPLAKIAAGTETRGQNSFVNYSGINAQNRYKNAKLQEDLETARRRGQDVEPILKALRNNGEEWQYAPQSAFLLPPEVLDINYRGGMPDYMTPYIKPNSPTNMPGYHWSHSKLSMTDPRYSGTGIKGEERERAALPGYNKGTYFYDNPNMREPGLGPNQHGARLEDMYDLAADPEKVGVTAFVENFDPKKGTIDKLKALNDREQAVLDLGYRGYKGQGGAVSFFPEAVNFLRKAD